MITNEVRARIWSGRSFRDYYVPKDNARDAAEEILMELERLDPATYWERYEILQDDRINVKLCEDCGNEMDRYQRFDGELLAGAPEYRVCSKCAAKLAANDTAWDFLGA